MPRLQQLFLMVLDYPLDLPQLGRPNPNCMLQSHRGQPELGGVVVALHMHVWRLAPVARIEEDSVWPNPQNGWHMCLATADIY
jgi:hypothetical protein